MVAVCVRARALIILGVESLLNVSVMLRCSIVSFDSMLSYRVVINVTVSL